MMQRPTVLALAVLCAVGAAAEPSPPPVGKPPAFNFSALNVTGTYGKDANGTCARAC